MGGGEEPGARAGGPEDALDQRGDRALAVRAGEVDGAKREVGATEAVDQGARSREPEARLAALETVLALVRRPVRVPRDQGR
jgi:hypothetical protein